MTPLSVYANRVPSGDQTSPVNENPAVSRSIVKSVPSREAVHTCEFVPPSVQMNASLLPSGDHRNSISAPGLSVIWNSSEPSGLTT